jgi:tryptophan halogenase
MHLVHSGLLRWLDLFPSENCPAFAREYNRLTQLEYERVLDFHWLPFALSQRVDSTYWRACKAAGVSEQLSHRVALFRQRGNIANYEQETFSSPTWASLLLANQCWPQKYDTRLQGINIEQVQRYTSQLKSHIQQVIATMPSQDDYLSAYHAY